MSSHPTRVCLCGDRTDPDPTTQQWLEKNIDNATVEVLLGLESDVARYEACKLQILGR